MKIAYVTIHLDSKIIRLSLVIEKLDATCKHILVHTGQNYDVNLNDIFLAAWRASA